MKTTFQRFGSRLVWATIVGCHRVGLFSLFSSLANRYVVVGRGDRPGAFPVVRRRRRNNLQVLIYHRVSPRPDCFLPATPLRTFESQMNCLARRFQVMHLDAAVEAAAEDRLPENAVAITFDDGYRDNYEHALPILAGLSLTATVFLSTGVIGTDRLLWHDRVFRAFSVSRAMKLTGFGPELQDADLTDPIRREACRDQVLRYLRTLAPEERDRHIDELEERLKVETVGPWPPLMLDWDEVREMKSRGISFGAHTVTHPVLSQVSPEQARHEIVESKKEVERHLEAEVTAFAYPNGKAADFDVTTKEILREAGFKFAVTTIFGTNPPETGRVAWDPFEIRRGGPEDAEAELFAAKMNAYKLLT